MVAGAATAGAAKAAGRVRAVPVMRPLPRWLRLLVRVLAMSGLLRRPRWTGWRSCWSRGGTSGAGGLGSAFEGAKARGEAPFHGTDTDDAVGAGGRVVVADKIMSGPFRGFRQAEVDSSSLGDELKKTLLNMANHDPFMRKLLDRREQSRKDGERLRVRQEVREEVKAEALVELQPELERMEVLKERARFEVMAELQEERKGIDEERTAMERVRVRIREEEQANLRRDMMMNVIGGGEGPGERGGGVAVAERPAEAPEAPVVEFAQVSVGGNGDADGSGGDPWEPTGTGGSRRVRLGSSMTVGVLFCLTRTSSGPMRGPAMTGLRTVVLWR